MTNRPPQIVVASLAVLLGLALASVPASAAGGKRGGSGQSGHGYSGGSGHGGGHYRSRRHSGYNQPGTKRRLHYSRGHRSGYYPRYRSHRFGRHRWGRYSWRPHYRSYYRGYAGSYYRYYDAYPTPTYYDAYPTPTYYYTPRYYGYYPARSYYEQSLEREVGRLQSRLAYERYAKYYWRAWPPYYNAPGPSAEGACLYGPDEALIYQPKGKSCASSLAAR